jgi:diketogulonate reductase-like aldo/keto reductase
MSEVLTAASSLRKEKIALGMGGIFEGKEAKTLSKFDYVRILQDSLELGFKLIDTAPAYADGTSEEIVGLAIQRRRPDVSIATKVSPENLDAVGIVRSVESSLRRLRTDYIDLLQIHWPNPTINLDQTARAMVDLVNGGKILQIGVANFSVPLLDEFSKLVPSHLFFSSQVEMSLIERYEVSRSLVWTRAQGLVTLAYSPLGKGRLAADPAIFNELSRIASGTGATVPQLCLKWLVDLGDVVPVVASRNVVHLKENLAFLDFPWHGNEFETLNGILEQSTVHLLVPSAITVATDGDGNRAAYQTVAQARENLLGFAPSPSQLAEEIKSFHDIKPVRVQRRGEEFFLVEGRVRYWAWVIAFGDSRPIPATEVPDVVQ